MSMCEQTKKENRRSLKISNPKCAYLTAGFDSEKKPSFHNGIWAHPSPLQPHPSPSLQLPLLWPHCRSLQGTGFLLFQCSCCLPCLGLFLEDLTGLFLNSFQVSLAKSPSHRGHTFIKPWLSTWDIVKRSSQVGLRVLRQRDDSRLSTWAQCGHKGPLIKGKQQNHKQQQKHWMICFEVGGKGP